MNICLNLQYEKMIFKRILDLLSDYVNKSYKFTMSYLTSPLLSDVRESERLVLLVVNKSVFQNMYSFIKLNDSNMQFASFSCLETAVNSMRLTMSLLQIRIICTNILLAETFRFKSVKMKFQKNKRI